MPPRNQLIAALLAIVLVLSGLMLYIASVSGDSASTENTPTPRNTPLPINYNPPALNTPVATATTLPLIGSPVPTAEIQTLDGTPFRLTDYEGKVLVINFWASWCLPCQEELPLLESFAATAGDDVKVIAVTNPNNGQTIELVNQFLADYHISEDMIALDMHNILHSMMGVVVLPSTFFIDANGTVTDVSFGVLTVEQVRTYVQAMQG